MPKYKTYFKFEIPTSAVNIVISVCKDYARREKMIKFSSVTGQVLDNCVRLNGEIDKALDFIEPGIRKYILDDIINGRGYNYSQASPYCAEGSYYKRKRKFIHDLAQNLNLIV